jgi:hypothetical protein
MGELEDDKREIMDAVKIAIGAALDHHMVQCPVLQIQERQNEVRKDLYNGGDGKTGVVPEIRALITLMTEDRRRKKQFWAVAAVVIVGFCGFFYQPINQTWQSFGALMRLADKADSIIKLTDDWQRYYATPPTPDNPAPVPKPKRPQKSFFQKIPHGVSSKEAPPPEDAGLPAQYDSTRR